MKLKSLLAIVSFSAIGGSLAVGIALSISVPSVAEIVKDSQIKLETTNIQNKDYRNKQSTPSMVGSWKSGVEDNENRYVDPQEIYMDIKSDGTTTYAFRREGKADGFANGPYQYTSVDSQSGILVEGDEDQGRTFETTIKWISNNEFILTLIKDSHASHRNGLQRRFIRIQEPVATILQQRAQQAANQQRYRNLQRSRDNYNDVKNSWGEFNRSF
ncbi:hypothetical protein I4641_19615 [Waterburya agarophytonicola K14]|uniref:Uncharacterized protein n=1 Tax=Waterburya agarophytonicola KI4 TaxID=2874699 RepID=A0A964BWV5_9CYAN|nr:hypothetical protein [Waterburya agarophytonicola]MCC0179177.1 hypothetical protein [Waterburya agarophytonicola KI4]